jgi:hypothetical protein
MRIAIAAAASALAPWLSGQILSVPPETSASCSLDLRPAKVVILGGVSASGLKPTDVAAQLDRQMEVFERTVQNAQGVLVRLERVRSITTARSSNDARTSALEMVQRVRAEFNADAPIDSILNQLLLIGLDRFDDSLENNSSRQTNLPVRYVFRDFNGAMQAFRDKCQMQAEKQFCEEHSEQCLAGVPRNAAGSFVARSEERVLRPEGGSTYLEWMDGMTGRVSPDRADPQLLGNLLIHMKATYSLTPMVIGR